MTIMLVQFTLTQFRMKHLTNLCFNDIKVNLNNVS